MFVVVIPSSCDDPGMIPGSSHEDGINATNIPGSSHEDVITATNIPGSSHEDGITATNIPASSHEDGSTTTNIPGSSHEDGITATNIPRSSQGMEWSISPASISTVPDATPTITISCHYNASSSTASSSASGPDELDQNKEEEEGEEEGEEEEGEDDESDMSDEEDLFKGLAALARSGNITSISLGRKCGNANGGRWAYLDDAAGVVRKEAGVPEAAVFTASLEDKVITMQLDNPGHNDACIYICHAQQGAWPRDLWAYVKVPEA